jgi:hypothetical protein
MSVEEAQQARDAFVKKRKQRKQRNQGNDAPRTMDNTTSVPAEPTTPDHVGNVFDVQKQEDRPVRHRRSAPREQDGLQMTASPNGQQTALSDGQHAE